MDHIALNMIIMVLPNLLRMAWMHKERCSQNCLLSSHIGQRWEKHQWL